MARVFQPKYTKDLINDTDHHITLLLTAIHNLDCKLIQGNGNYGRNTVETGKKATKKTPKMKIKSTSNLTSMLNLPAIMILYGPLRLLWEGGYKGEATMTNAKKQLRRVLTCLGLPSRLCRDTTERKVWTCYLDKIKKKFRRRYLSMENFTIINNIQLFLMIWTTPVQFLPWDWRTDI